MKFIYRFLPKSLRSGFKKEIRNLSGYNELRGILDQPRHAPVSMQDIDLIDYFVRDMEARHSRMLVQILERLERVENELAERDAVRSDETPAA